MNASTCGSMLAEHTAAIDGDVGNAALYLGRARLRLAAGGASAAASALIDANEAICLDPSSSAALLFRALCLAKLNPPRLQCAHGTLERVRSLDSGLADAVRIAQKAPPATFDQAIIDVIARHGEPSARSGAEPS